MLHLGELLKNKRTDLGLNISQVSDSTKIPRKLITALENSDYSVFSSEVYLKGFLKNYAKFLELDINKALAIYRRERENLNEESLNDAQKPIKEQKAIITPGKLVFIFSSIIVISVIAFIVIQINKITRPPLLELTEPVQGSAPDELYTEVNSDTINLSGKVEVGSKLLINGSEVTTNNLQEFRIDNYKLNPGSNEIVILAESYYFSKISQINLTVIANIQDDEENESTDKETEKDTEETTNNEEVIEIMKIEIVVGPEESWIVATVDGKTTLSDIVQPDESYTFEASESFTIYSPRPQMVDLTINYEKYTFSSQDAAIFKIINGNVVQE